MATPPKPPPAPAPNAPPQTFTASIYAHPSPLPPRFCELITELEGLIKAPVWLLIQNHGATDERYSEITLEVYKGFQVEVGSIDPQSAAILLESPGGNPAAAYRIARLFQRKAKKLLAVVPQYAKSAATLIALAGDDLILGRDAELGPLDLQVFDHNQEMYDSALNAVQALERLGAYSLTAVDQTMQLLLRRVPKRTDVLLPHALNYVAALLKPLFEKVDTVDYARKSRDLKMTEEYAARLMRRTVQYSKGKEIARKLVQNYPAHGFVVDRDEVTASDDLQQNPENAYGLGIKAIAAEQKLQDVLDELVPFLDSLCVVGRIKEAGNG